MVRRHKKKKRPDALSPIKQIDIPSERNTSTLFLLEERVATGDTISEEEIGLHRYAFMRDRELRVGDYLPQSPITTHSNGLDPFLTTTIEEQRDVPVENLHHFRIRSISGLCDGGSDMEKKKKKKIVEAVRMDGDCYYL
ncbi:uncharacterized protein A4U43_C04F22900 [Asparagus officinalis]|uniref:Uncharacterized protein n=1 Tax=Asparagus officinalis TaxID=4686 RepID=A0A5P1F3M2_ASPOF|nr:uncharacterized protein A4U43_C04F22900 [Asparagus officinalis]